MGLRHVLWGLASFVACASAEARTFYANQLLRVPAYFEDLSRRPIEIEAITQGSTRNEASYNGIRISMRDPNPAKDRTKWEVANAIVHHWMKKDLLREAQFNVLFRLSKVPAQGEAHWKRLRDVAIAALLGKLKNHPDPAARIWWKLKFDPSPKPQFSKLKKGEKILLVIHQTGYPAPGGWDAGDLDFGHSVVALRTVGGDGESDRVINPGAKLRSNGSEVDLPVFAKDEILSMIRVANLWNWAEFVLAVRGMELKYRILRMTPEQTEAMEMLARKGDWLTFGSALAWGNNCADGVFDIIQGLLPAGQSLGEKASLVTKTLREATNFTLPIWSLARAQEQLPLIGYHRVRLLPGFVKDASGDYTRDNYPVKAETRSYRDYRDFERALR